MKTGKTLRNFLLVLAALALVVFLTVSFGLFSPSSRSPCDAITPAVNARRAGVEPRPY